MRSSLVVALAAIITVCYAQPLSREEARQRAHDLMTLGQRLFFSPALSVSGRISCSSCHDPKFAYGPPNARAIQPGGEDLQQLGHRAAPSLRYLQGVPQFAEHYFDSEIAGDDSTDNGPTGGLTWDGRVDRGRDQARIPLLSPFEMGNKNPQEVVQRALRAESAAELKRLSRGNLFEIILEALEAFEQNEKEFYPYTSKYDAWLAGKARLSATETLGLSLFTDPKKGNCSPCHPASRGVNGTPPRFTDYGFAALGVPRNHDIPANADPAWFDLGLCGPDRTDYKGRSEYCGKFRTPSLRNVAIRKAFFHNGVFHTLRDAVSFYVKRDMEPATAGFDDLPPQFRDNVERGAPFGHGSVVLSDDEIDAIVVFLGTLSDGYAGGAGKPFD